MHMRIEKLKVEIRRWRLIDGEVDGGGLTMKAYMHIQTEELEVEV